MIVTMEIPTPDGTSVIRGELEFGPDSRLPMAHVAEKLEEWREQALEWWHGRPTS